MTEFKPGDRVEIGHSDMHAYIVRRPTKEEFPRMLKAYVDKLDKDAAGYITLEASWVIRIPVQEDWDVETIELEEEVVLWKQRRSL